MTEIVANASRISNAMSLPLIRDADTGYGNELNVYRTVQEFERAGVAGIHIEDQVFPKRCGHPDNKENNPPKDRTPKNRSRPAPPTTAGLPSVARTLPVNNI